MNYHDMISRVKLALMSMQRMSWEQGVAAQAFFEIGDIQTGILLAKEAVHRQLDDGRMAIISDFGCSVDSSVNGVPVLWAAEYTGDSKLLQAALRMADYFLEEAQRSDNGVICHFHSPKDSNESPRRQIMVDGIYHLAPFLSMCGHNEEALKQIYGMKELLYDSGKRLYRQMWDDDKKDYARADFWGGGNGWMAATLPRVLRLLPASMKNEKTELAKHFKELVDGMLSHQRKDALFHDVLDKPDTFVEATAAMMLSYAIFRGMEGGWLDDEYLKPALKIRSAAHQRVDKYGIVQDVCGAPSFDAPGTSPEAQGFLLLSEAAYLDLKKFNCPRI